MMNRVWLITGAARGMGRAITETALQNGDNVIGITRKDNDLDLSEQYSGCFLHCKLDIANGNEKEFEEIVKKAVEHFGKIDVLVNNAGHGRITNFEEQVRRIFAKFLN